MKNTFELRGEVTAIFLRYKGSVLETIINTSDLPSANKFPNRWYASWSPLTKSFYCIGRYHGKTLGLHRWITNCSEIMQVDHFDNDTLNNRRQNLRIVTFAENMQNRAGANRNSKSGVRGVHWESDRQKWRGLVRVKGKRIDLGRFDSVQEAEKAVKAARAKYMPYSKERKEMII